MERTTVSIKLEGMTELVAAMRRLPIAVRGKALEDAVTSGAQVVAQAAGDRAAGAFQSRTGKLLRAARSLTTRMIRTLARSPEYVLVEVWPKLPYTHLVEAGHRIIARGRDRKGLGTTPTRGRGGRFAEVSGRRGQLRQALLARRAAGGEGVVAARAFVGPAFDATKEQAGQRVLDELWKNIERAWTGGR